MCIYIVLLYLSSFKINGVWVMSDIDWSKAPDNCIGHSVSSAKNNYWITDEDLTIGAPDYGLLEVKFTPIPPKQKSKPVYTQELEDNGSIVEAGMLFATEAGEYTAEYTNKKSIVFTDEDGFLISINRRYAKPIDMRTDEEKALDDLIKRTSTALSKTVLASYILTDIKAGRIHNVTWSK